MDWQATEFPPGFILQAPPATTLTIFDGAVVIHKDGRVEFGSGYNPDTAAKRFWEAVSKAAPNMCR